MSKEYTTKSTRFPGVFSLPDFLTFSNLARWEKALSDAKAVSADGKLVITGDYYLTMIPAILSIVDKFQIGGGWPDPVTKDNFPANSKLVLTFMEGIMDVYAKTNEPDPN